MRNKKVITIILFLLMISLSSCIQQKQPLNPSQKTKDPIAAVEKNISEHNENKEDKSPAVIYETKQDINGDTNPELIILTKEEVEDADACEYTNLLIYSSESAKEPVFNLNKAGIEINGISVGITTDLIQIEDRNRDGLSELYLEEPYGCCSPNRVLIISYLENSYKIIFFDVLDIDTLEYKDIDGDGTLELYGTVYWGGQTPVEKGFDTVFKPENFEYKPSYVLTRLIYENKLKDAEKAFETNQTPETLSNLLWSYGILGLELKGTELMNKYNNLLEPVMYEDLTIDFKDLFHDIIYQYNEYWSYLKTDSENK